MSEKQFELEVLSNNKYVIAEFDRDNYYLDDENSAKSLEYRLNELFDENEQLNAQKLNIEVDRDYFRTKTSSLEEGYLHLQNREIQLKEENEQLKKENKLLKKRLAEQNDIEWLRNNTVWEVMPSNRRTFISTIYHRRNDE